jgi:hypothetical protein
MPPRSMRKALFVPRRPMARVVEFDQTLPAPLTTASLFDDNP